MNALASPDDFGGVVVDVVGFEGVGVVEDGAGADDEDDDGLGVGDATVCWLGPLSSPLEPQQPPTIRAKHDKTRRSDIE